MNISIPTSSNFLTELRDILFERIKVAKEYKTLNPEELRLENETTVAIISLSKAITRQMNAAARLGELDLTVNPYAKDACELLLKKQANTMTNISTTVAAPASNMPGTRPETPKKTKTATASAALSTPDTKKP